MKFFYLIGIAISFNPHPREGVTFFQPVLYLLF